MQILLKNIENLSLALVFLALMFTSMVKAESLAPTVNKGALITFAGVSDNAALQNLQNSVDIYQRVKALTNKSVIDSYQWQRLKSRALQQILDALKPYGYYRATIESVTEPRANQLLFNIDLGEPVRISQLALSVVGEARDLIEVQQWLKGFPLQQGGVLVQPSHDAAKAELNRLMRRFGYFDAAFVEHEITIDESRTNANINLKLDSGSRYSYGETSLIWPDAEHSSVYTEAFLGRYLNFEANQPFDLHSLQKAQSQMATSNYFSSITIRPLIDQAKAGVVPIEAAIELPTRFAYGATLGFGTDSGLRGGLSFENRRFNNQGHRFNAQMITSQEKQTAVVNYSRPINGSTRDGANIFASLVNENSDARDSQIWLAGVDFSNSPSEKTQLSYGASYRDERFVDAGERLQTRLLLPTLSWQTVSTADSNVSDFGYRFSATLRGAEDSLGSDISLVQLTLNAKSVLSLGRGKLLWRAQLGQTWIGDDARLPASLSFFTGGDHSVRGYRFESIGVVGSDSVLRGASNMVAASVEYQHQIKGNFALATFIDAGDAYDNSLSLKFAVGVGARWRLPFGALRLDFASARDLAGQPIRVHFTFGSDL